MQPLQDAHQADGLQVLGINPGGLFGGESEETLALFVEQTGVSFPILWDGGTYGFFAWPQAISPFPRQAVLGRDGRVRYLASDHDAAALEAAVLHALAE